MNRINITFSTNTIELFTYIAIYNPATRSLDEFQHYPGYIQTAKQKLKLATVMVVLVLRDIGKFKRFGIVVVTQ